MTATATATAPANKLTMNPTTGKLSVKRARKTKLTEALDAVVTAAPDSAAKVAAVAVADKLVTAELAKADKAAQKAERAAAAAAKRNAKETEKASKLEAREAVARGKAEAKAAAKVKPTHYLGRLAEQNGVKAPQREGSISKAWDLFDSATGAVYTAHLPQLAEQTGCNLENLRIELRRWRKFNGVEALGRMPMVEAAAE